MSEGRVRRFPVGVADPCLKAGDGELRSTAAPIVDKRLFLGSWLVLGGMLATLLPPGCGRLLLLLDRTFPFFAGVDGSRPPLSPVMTTEDAGELPGVS